MTVASLRLTQAVITIILALAIVTNAQSNSGMPLSVIAILFTIINIFFVYLEKQQRPDRPAKALKRATVLLKISIVLLFAAITYFIYEFYS